MVLKTITGTLKFGTGLACDWLNFEISVEPGLHGTNIMQVLQDYAVCAEFGVRT
jgi:hypothetical protein